MKKITLVAAIAILTAGAIQAQEAPPFTFNLGAGFVEPIGTFGRYNDTGWNVQGGAGFNFNQWASLMLDANFNNMGINSTTLNNFGAPGGTVQIWSFTVDPVVHLTGQRKLDVYVTGGGGLYRREDQLTAPTAGFEPVFGPFGFFNVPVVGNQVLASYSVNRPGFDLGAGVNLGSKWRAKFYAEARYNRMFTEFGVTDYIPVTFGIRF
jgi:opacity protein-like surface antigen